MDRGEGIPYEGTYVRTCRIVKSAALHGALFCTGLHDKYRTAVLYCGVL